MDVNERIERALVSAVEKGERSPCPPGLSEAIRHAVFPGGARVRPRLCVAVAAACGEDEPALTDNAAAAIELLHCASLIHDDLPCFDDAATRRGRPSVHQAYGEPLAVLAGDALIVLAFQTLAGTVVSCPSRVMNCISVVGGGVGVPGGIVAGQAWECEPDIPLEEYQRAKTGALFAAATGAGAAAAGADPEQWRQLGEELGRAYQMVDDILDVTGEDDEIGKPTGQDVAHDRPSVVREQGIEGALRQYSELKASMVEAIPPCPGRSQLQQLILLESQRILPAELAGQAV